MTHQYFSILLVASLQYNIQDYLVISSAKGFRDAHHYHAVCHSETRQSIRMSPKMEVHLNQYIFRLEHSIGYFFKFFSYIKSMMFIFLHL